MSLDNVISPDVEVAASVSEEASIDERINRIMAIMESEKERNIKLKKIAIELQSLGHLFNQLEKDGEMPVGEELEIIEDAVEQIVLSVKVLQEAI